MSLDQGYPGTQSVGRAIGLLRAIASHGRKGMRIDEIVAISGLTKTTCARLLRRLVDEGLLEKQVKTEKFYLGRGLHELGLLARQRYELREVAGESLRSLADLTHDTVYLSERIGSESVLVAKQPGKYSIKEIAQDVGVRRPLGVGAGGLAILAFLQPREREYAIAGASSRYRGFKGVTVPRVLKLANEAADRGYVVGPSYGIPGVMSVSKGFSVNGSVGAISVTATSDRLTTRRQELVATLLAQHLAALTELDTPAKDGPDSP